MKQIITICLMLCCNTAFSTNLLVKVYQGRLPEEIKSNQNIYSTSRNKKSVTAIESYVIPGNVLKLEKHKLVKTRQYKRSRKYNFTNPVKVTEGPINRTETTTSTNTKSIESETNESTTQSSEENQGYEISGGVESSFVDDVVEIDYSQMYIGTYITPYYVDGKLKVEITIINDDLMRFTTTINIKENKWHQVLGTQKAKGVITTNRDKDSNEIWLFVSDVGEGVS